MSVASEFAPEVFIPERARPSTQRRRHLAVVPVEAPLDAARHSVPAVSPARVSPPIVCVEEAVTVRPLRLTRRGRVVLMIVLAAAAGVLLLAAHASLGQAPRGGAGASAGMASAGAATATVQPGDTLWSIAQRVEPSRDPRAVVDELTKLNRLSGTASLSPGQTLKLR